MIEALSNALKSSHIICVTGKMASGKNTVCQILEENGAACVDADALVHEAIRSLNDVIIETFEPFASEKKIQIKNDDGSVNRRALGVLLFDNPKLLELQEEIIYPKVIALTKDFLEKNDSKLCVINATVLYKTPELMNLCDLIIFVDSSFFKRFRRAKKRDGMKTRVILKRFKSQKSL